MIDDGGITARRSRRSPANRCAYGEIARALPVRWIGSEHSKGHLGDVVCRAVRHIWYLSARCRSLVSMQGRQQAVSDTVVSAGVQSRC